MRNLRGVTLVEVVVALLVLTVGAVALAGVAGTVAQMAGSGADSSRLAALLGGRVERLQGTACEELSQGMERSAGFELRWSVTAEGRGRRLTVRALSSARTPRAVTITRFVYCPA